MNFLFFISKETAYFMAKLYNILNNKSKVSILDAGQVQERLDGFCSDNRVDLLYFEKYLELIYKDKS